MDQDIVCSNEAKTLGVCVCQGFTEKGRKEKKGIKIHKIF